MIGFLIKEVMQSNIRHSKYQYTDHNLAIDMVGKTITNEIRMKIIDDSTHFLTPSIDFQPNRRTDMQPCLSRSGHLSRSGQLATQCSCVRSATEKNNRLSLEASPVL